MKIAIVILNWNGKSLLEKFLPSVTAFAEGADIYVADNASTDTSVEYIKNNYPQVRIIQNNVNGGFAKGYNDALKKVDADVFCLLNSDVEVTKNWLTPILEQFKAMPQAAIVQPKILDYKRKSHFEYAGAAGGFIDKFGYPFCRGRVFQSLEEDHGQYNDVSPIFWATGACMFIRKSVFHDLGGFDEDYFAHQEEIDLCWRAINRGHGIFYNGNSHVYHLGGATLNSMNPKKTFYNFRNSLYSITKNLPKRKVFPLLLARLILDGVAAVRFLFQLKFNHLFAIFMAHTSFYKNFSRTFKKRHGKHSTQKYYACNSVVWSYFVLKKSSFAELVKH